MDHIFHHAAFLPLRDYHAYLLNGEIHHLRSSNSIPDPTEDYLCNIVVGFTDVEESRVTSNGGEKKKAQNFLFDDILYSL